MSGRVGAFEIYLHVRRKGLCGSTLVRGGRWIGGRRQRPRFVDRNASSECISLGAWSPLLEMGGGTNSMARYPTAKVPESCEGVSIDLLRRVLRDACGNVGDAAHLLGVPSSDLRAFVRMTPELMAVLDEATELFCDRAEAILREALESDNEARRDVASRFVLSGRGAARGWARPAGMSMTIDQPQAPLIVKWLDAEVLEETKVGNGPALIEGTAINDGAT